MMGKSFPFRYSGERTLVKIESLNARGKGEKVHALRASLQKIMMHDCSVFLACQAIVKDYQCPEVVLEPLPGFKVLKDLVVDIDPFLERIQNLRPFLIASVPPEKERKQTPEEGKKVEEAIRCILCACCTASCPASWIQKKYLGPAALVWASRYIFESRDSQLLERLQQIDHPDGAWGCVNHFECTRVCPKEIPVTQSINTIKREIEKRLR